MTLDRFEPDAALVPLLDDWTVHRLGLVDEQIRRASQRVGREGGQTQVGGLYARYGRTIVTSQGVPQIDRPVVTSYRNDW